MTEIPKKRRPNRFRLYETGTEYLLAVINGEVPVPVDLRIKAGIALAQRESLAPKGVKHLRQQAALDAATDAFAPPSPPKSKFDA